MVVSDHLENLYHRYYMRDKIINDNKYFELFIDEKQSLIHDSIDRIESGVLTDDNVPFAKYQIFLFSFEILIAKYSAGLLPEELISDYTYSIRLLSDGWDDNVVKFKLGNKVLDQYMLNQYCYLVWMISIGILLNVDKKERFVLKDLIVSGNIKDELILFLLEIMTKSHFRVDRIKTTYSPFKNLVKNVTNIEISNGDIKQYLDGWYKNTKLLTWHNYSQTINKARYYYGYWSFESAAIVAILNLDDISFRDNQYYPKDLVDYYKSTSKGLSS